MRKSMRIRNLSEDEHKRIREILDELMELFNAESVKLEMSDYTINDRAQYTIRIKYADITDADM